MTTFSYTITLDDSESIALEAALDLMIDQCKQRIEAGEGAPHIAHLHNCERIRQKLRSSTPQMTSANNLWNNP